MDVLGEANGPVGLLSYNSKLQCRIRTDYTDTAHTAELIFFASTFEEAVTNNISTIPTVPPGVTADDN